MQQGGEALPENYQKITRLKILLIFQPDNPYNQIDGSCTICIAEEGSERFL